MVAIEKGQKFKSNKIGSSMGLRILDLVIYDIKVGTPMFDKPFDINFPGRKGKQKQKNRLDFFYMIPKSNSSARGYEDNAGMPHIGWLGVRWWFIECLMSLGADQLLNGTSHIQKPKLNWWNKK